MTKAEKLEEYAKCLQDPIYAIEKYLKTYSVYHGGFTPFKLYSQQKRAIIAFEEHTYNVVKKSRQVGCSVTTAAYLAYKFVFADKSNPEKIYIICNLLKTAKDFLKNIKDFALQFPSWMIDGYTKGKNKENDLLIVNSTSQIQLLNGSLVQALAANSSARGLSPTIIAADELAFFQSDPEETKKSIMAALSTGGKFIAISTPNGLDPHYYPLVQGSIDKENDFNIISMYWFLDKRYQKGGITWVKKDLEGEIIETIEETNYDDDHLLKMYNSGYKAETEWYHRMCKSMNNNKRAIAAELDVQFLGSGANVIDTDTILKHEKHYQCDPLLETSFANQLWVWAEPLEDHKYILTADVAAGDGADYSGFHVIDVETLDHCVEFKGKISETELAKLINEVGLKYNAYVVVDITGGMGRVVVSKLLALEYPSLHYDDSSIDELKETNVRKSKERPKTAGFKITTRNRPAIINKIIEYIENFTFKIKSIRLIAELKTFIWNNGKAEHARMFNDDLIIALGIGLYVLESSFRKIEKATKVNKAMLSSWISSSKKKTSQQTTTTKRKAFYGMNNPTNVSKTPLNYLLKRGVHSPSVDPHGNFGWVLQKPKHKIVPVIKKDKKEKE